MDPVIRLDDFIREMDVFGDEYKAYLNVRTGEFITLSDQELNAAEEGESSETNQWLDPDMVEKATEVLFSEDYESLPDKFEIHEYSIMKKFCYSVEDDELRARLLNAIHGRGAFRYFKDIVFEHGIRDDWFAYREQAFKEIAIDWLEYHGLAYAEEEQEED